MFNIWFRVGVEKGFGDMEESFIKTTYLRYPSFVRDQIPHY